MEAVFSIASYVGPKPLLFGMSAQDAERIVGPPLRVAKNTLGETNAQYKTLSIRYSKADGSLVEAGFVPPANVTLGGLDVFQDSDVFRKIVSQDTSPYEYLGFIILLDLGMTLGGFHDDDPAQCAVTVFVRGRWDHLKSKFKKFKMD